jgi:hypothetical protein
MSRTSRWILGSFALLFAWTFISALPYALKPLVLWVCAGFCVLIALACFSTVAHGPALRVIGATVFAAYLLAAAANFADALKTPFDGHFHGRWFLFLEAVVEGFVIYGLPGLYVAVHGRYPRWGHAAIAFLGRNRSENSGSAQHAQENEPL